MAQRRSHLFLNAATTASAGEDSRYLVDYRFDNGGLQRTVWGTLTSGAEVGLYYTVSANAVSVTHLETVVSAGSSSFTTATNSFVEVLNGPFKFAEVRKVGASGTATVIGYL